MNLSKLQEKIKVFLDKTHTIAKGPLKYRSQFSRIVHGTFRRDYILLGTIHFLSGQAAEMYFTFGNSCMDLARRPFEDMISLEFMKLKGKESMAKKFMDFEKVEAMRDISYLKSKDFPIEAKFESKIMEDFEKVKKRFSDKRSLDGVRRSWAGVDVETMVSDLLDANIISQDEISTLLQVYQRGCYKNHFSPSDIHAFLSNDLYELNSKSDIDLALLSSYSSVVKIAQILTQESEVGKQTDKFIDNAWSVLLSAHETHIFD